MKQYTVQQGDTLWKISKSNGVSLEAVIAANPQITDPNAISVGQTVNIPSTPEADSTVIPQAPQTDLSTTGSTGASDSMTSGGVTPGSAALSADGTAAPAPGGISAPPAGTNATSGSAAPAVSAPKWGQMWKYVVKNQDTMWKIAKQAGVTLEQLIAANPQVANPDQIQPGQVLNIPSGSMLMKQKSLAVKGVSDTQTQIAPSATPNAKELLTMPKPTAVAPSSVEVPVMETKPKFELPAMEFPKLPSMPNITVPSINVPINMPIQANDVVEQKTYNIGPVGNKPYNAPVFQQSPVASAPVASAPFAHVPMTAPVAQAPAMGPAPVYMMPVVEHHHPHCICKTVIHAPHCGCYPHKHHKHLHHHHMHPEYYMHYAYVQPHPYVAPNYYAMPGYQQNPMYYGAAQAGAPGELGPTSYQPYQPTNQSATIR